MASTTVVDAAAGATAGVTSAVGTGSPAGDASADNGAILTDDSILGLGPESTESTTSTGEPTQAVQDTTAAQSAAPQELSIDDFKSLFKDNPKVNSLWDRYSSEHEQNSRWTQRLGTPKQIDQIADSLDLIGGAEQLVEMVNDRAEEEQAYSALAAGSPEDRKNLLTNYAQWWGPQAFADVSRIGLDVMKSAAPDEYKALADQFFSEAFKSEGVYGHLATLQKARQANDADTVGRLVDEMIQWAYNRFNPNEGQGQSLEAKRIEAERQKLASERQSWQQKTQQESFERVSNSVRTSVNGAIENLLGTLKVNNRPVFGENSAKAKAMVSQEIYNRSFEKVNSNPIVVARLRSMEAAGGAEKDTIDLLVKAYNGVLKSVAEEVIGEWTQGFVGQQKAQLERAKAAASRPDAGSSVSRGERTNNKLTAKDIEKAGGYGKLSDDQILDL